MRRVLCSAFAAAACLGIATVAFAQSEQRDARRRAPAPPQPEEMWRISKMVGLPVHDENREKIGTVAELLMRADGRIHAVAVDTSTVLEPNQPVVAVPFEQLAFNELSVRSTERLDSDRREGKTMTMTEKRIVRIAGESDWRPNHAVLRALSVQWLRTLPTVDLAPR